MGLGQLLDEIREYYVERFVAAINEHSADSAVTVVHEAAFCDANGDIVSEGRLAIPSRGDLLIVRDGVVEDSLQVDTDGMVSFEAVQFEWPVSKLAVEMQPFQWNWLPLQLNGLESNVDWSPLRAWFMRWFQESEPAEGELLGGVHFLSDPEFVDGVARLSIDLGTAPAEAFEELLDVVVTLGAGSVRIGSISCSH